MTVLAFGSIAGSPGTTSLVVALAQVWPRSVLVVEVDPDGGRLAARCDLAVRPGLTELAAATRAGAIDSDGIWRFAQRSADGVDVVVAHPAAEQVQSALRAGAARIGETLAALVDTDVLVDVGRLRPGSPAASLAHGADRRIVVTGSTLDDAVLLVHRRELLDDLGGADVVVNGPGVHAADEVASAVGRDVLGSRPGRASMRTTARSRRRDVRWLIDLAATLCPSAGSSAVEGRVVHQRIPDSPSDPLVAAS